MSAYDELSDEMVSALMKGVLETDRAYNYNFDDICTGAKIAMDQLKAENESLRGQLEDADEQVVALEKQVKALIRASISSPENPS